MSDPGSDSARRGLLPLLVVSGVVVLVVAGLAHGLWLPNLHNALLGLAFTAVGAFILSQRPRHREGVLFMATGVVEAVVFAGRQVGHLDDGNPWLGWLGVWPVALCVGLVSLSVVCFPDGRLPSRRWRLPVGVAAAVMAGCAVTSALWPVEYAATGVVTDHPLRVPGAAAAAAVWGAVAHPAYTALQLLWVVAVVVRWRSSGRLVRAQLTGVGIAAAGSALLLVVGVAAAGTPRPGLLTAALVPVAAGWAIVHGQHLAAYAALSWSSRAVGQGRRPQDLPTDLARAVAEAFDAPRATVWMGRRDALHLVGAWPDPDDDDAGPSDLDAIAAGGALVRPVTRDGVVVGAVGVERATASTPASDRLLDDVAAQASLVIEYLDVMREAAQRHATAGLEQLSPREREVLHLMARGLSNAAICGELHLSVKTVEPVVSSIFTKLGLLADPGSNRRVLAVLAFLRT